MTFTEINYLAEYQRKKSCDICALKHCCLDQLQAISFGTFSNMISHILRSHGKKRICWTTFINIKNERINPGQTSFFIWIIWKKMTKEKKTIYNVPNNLQAFLVKNPLGWEKLTFFIEKNVFNYRFTLCFLLILH